MRFFITLVLATIMTCTYCVADYGRLNLVRDYQISYDPTKYTHFAEFAQHFRAECIKYNLLLFTHHQIDAPLDQLPAADGSVFAFCGGVSHRSTKSKPLPVHDHTEGLSHFAGYKIIKGPLSAADCKAYAIAHPKAVIRCK